MKKIICILALFAAFSAFAQEKPDTRMQTYAELLKEANARIVHLSAELAKAQEHIAELQKAQAK